MLIYKHGPSVTHALCMKLSQGKKRKPRGFAQPPLHYYGALICLYIGGKIKGESLIAFVPLWPPRSKTLIIFLLFFKKYHYKGNVPLGQVPFSAALTQLPLTLWDSAVLLLSDKHSARLSSP